jgi:hypothetical protein
MGQSRLVGRASEDVANRLREPRRRARSPGTGTGALPLAFDDARGRIPGRRGRNRIPGTLMSLNLEPAELGQESLPLVGPPLLDRGAAKLNLARAGLVQRAVVRAGFRRVRLSSFKHPREDDRERVDIAIGEDRIAEIRPAVAHQVDALLEVGGVSESERVTDLMHGHPREFLGRVLLELRTRRRHGADDDVAAVLPAAERDPSEISIGPPGSAIVIAIPATIGARSTRSHSSSVNDAFDVMDLPLIAQKSA